jgi:hypothetical protein
MKFYLWIILSITISLTCQAQTIMLDSFISTSIDTFPKKQYKREFYFSYYKPFFYRNEVTYYSDLYDDMDGEYDSEYNLLQDFRKYNFTYRVYRSLSIGYTKKVSLTKKASLKYGMGLKILTFKFKQNFEVLNTNVISKVKVIKFGNQSEPDVISNTIIDNFQKNNIAEYEYLNLNDPGIFLASLELPLSLERKINEKLFIGADLSFLIPIAAEANGYVSTLGKTSEEGINADAVNRLYGNFGIHVKYNLYKRLYIESYFKTGEKLFDYNANTVSSIYLGIQSATLNSAGLKVGLNF